MTKELASRYNCATEFTLAVLGGKWKTVILCYLKERPLRYGELRTLIPKLSDKMLTQRLGEMIASGLIKIGKARGQRMRNVYMLTPRAKSLTRLLHELYEWGLENAETFEVSVGEPLKELGQPAGRN